MGIGQREGDSPASYYLRLTYKFQVAASGREMFTAPSSKTCLFDVLDELTRITIESLDVAAVQQG